ncbi:hypothetical protein ACSBR1_023864 [Camellia fascicularis]
MKALMIQQQNPGVDENNMSNLTSASGEASVSSGNKDESGTIYPPQQYFAPPPPPPNQTQPALVVKKKRNLPGNPDPEAEVIALSPKSLLATNRFVCEICNKGFQRDQNLQLHRRGHNLPWKLKQRTSKEVKKKVYVCPEASCVHHDPSRALGDLTGIKKHFCRKHGEKKWKCDKCSKKYAVRSDWKAHSKTCGTREYRCDCGTLFSRRDSFITHRAFCDALAEESARAITVNPLLSSTQLSTSTSSSHINLQVQIQPQFNYQDLHDFPMKKEQQSFSLRPDISVRPRLACPSAVVGAGPGPPPPSSIFPTILDQEFTHHQDHQLPVLHENTNPNPSLGPTTLQPYHETASSSSPHMSATALLQKAAQMGATMSSKANAMMMSMRPHHHQHQHHQAHVSANSGGGFGLNLSSLEEMAGGFVHFLSSFGNKAALSSALLTDHVSPSATAGTATDPGAGAPPSFLQDMMMTTSLSSTATGFDGSSFEYSFGDHGGGGGGGVGMLNPNKDGTISKASGGGSAGHGGGGNDGMTRDFLGLRPLSHDDILNIAGFTNHIDSPMGNQNQTQESWRS